MATIQLLALGLNNSLFPPLPDKGCDPQRVIQMLRARFNFSLPATFKLYMWSKFSAIDSICETDCHLNWHFFYCMGVSDGKVFV